MINYVKRLRNAEDKETLKDLSYKMLEDCKKGLLTPEELTKLVDIMISRSEYLDNEEERYKFAQTLEYARMLEREGFDDYEIDQILTQEEV